MISANNWHEVKQLIELQSDYPTAAAALSQEKNLATLFVVKYVYAARLRVPTEIINNRKSWWDLDPGFQVPLTENWDIGFEALF